MLDYISKNYEWIFSGIGILIISTIINFFYKKETNKEREKGNLNISNYEATKIRDEIKKSPPFQQNQISSNYYGIKIKWKLL